MQPTGIPTRNLKFEIAFFGVADGGLLTGDRRQFGYRTFKHLGILHCFADSHIDDDFLQARHLHIVFK